MASNTLALMDGVPIKTTRNSSFFIVKYNTSFLLIKKLKIINMRILICSDSHGNDQALEDIYKKHPNCDLYLHAGDSESDEWSIKPFESVQGNCDFRDDFPIRKIIPTPYGALLIQHHPHVAQNILIDKQIKIFVHGHTHRRKDEILDGLRIINPGSISFPRDQYDLSYVILDISKDEVKTNFYTLY